MMNGIIFTQQGSQTATTKTAKLPGSVNLDNKHCLLMSVRFGSSSCDTTWAHLVPTWPGPQVRPSEANNIFHTFLARTLSTAKLHTLAYKFVPFPTLRAIEHHITSRANMIYFMPLWVFSTFSVFIFYYFCFTIYSCFVEYVCMPLKFNCTQRVSSVFLFLFLVYFISFIFITFLLLLVLCLSFSACVFGRVFLHRNVTATCWSNEMFHSHR